MNSSLSAGRFSRHGLCLVGISERPRGRSRFLGSLRNLSSPFPSVPSPGGSRHWQSPSSREGQQVAGTGAGQRGPSLENDSGGLVWHMACFPAGATGALTAGQRHLGCHWMSSELISRSGTRCRQPPAAQPQVVNRGSKRQLTACIQTRDTAVPKGALGEARRAITAATTVQDQGTSSSSLTASRDPQHRITRLKLDQKLLTV